jgi:hypothetical protein
MKRQTTDRSRWTAYALLFILSVAPFSAWSSQVTRLFQIDRSLNANIVCYDATVTRRGLFSPTKPIIAYWLMNAEDGRKEEMTWFERAHVYGFTLQINPNRSSLIMHMDALGSRPISVSVLHGEPRAEIEINGRRVFLDRVFVEGSSSIFHSVAWVRLTGRDPETNVSVTEVIHP